MQGGESVERRVLFVGRIDELQRISARLQQREPCALIGPGGAGKSRLAYESALRWEAGGGRAVFVTLVGAVAGGVAADVARALGIRADGGLDALESLRAVELAYDLIVLDNAEVAPADVAAVVAALRDARPAVLVTSRAPIAGIAGLEIGPLNEADARRFFIARARVAQTVVDDADPAIAAQVARIVAQLEGLPIAIDLAAARLASLDVAELAGELERPRAYTFRARTGRDPRHWTLKRVVDWSLDRMEPRVQELFVLAARFANVFRAADAAAMAELDVADAARYLECLADNSLLMRVRTLDGYRMLAPIRHAALRRLLRSRNRRALDARFARCVTARARGLVEHVQSSGGYDRLTAIFACHGDLLAVLEWALQDPAARLGGCIEVPALLAFFWANGGSLEEGMRWCDRIAACAEELDPPQRARAYYLCMLVALPSCAYERMIALAPRAIALYGVQGDRLGLARAYNAYGIALLHTGAAADALAHAETALRLYEATGLARGIASALINCGSAHLDGFDDPRSARACFERGLAVLADTLDTDPTAAIALGNLAEVAYIERDGAQAEAYAQRALAIFRERGDEVRAAWQLGLRARVALLRADRAAAIAHLDEAFAILQRQPHREYGSVCIEVVVALLADDAPFQAAVLGGAVERIRAAWGLQHAIPARREARELLERIVARLPADAPARIERSAATLEFPDVLRMARSAIARLAADA